MKIIDIRLKNLNSLKGEWHIDFSSGSYTSDGIFAITGPTGAGKTTIFDAICLALYGQTPRLGKISGQSNEIMTKHTSECWAQVMFESSSRKYICSWSQHRAGKNGNLQSAKHILSEFPGEILSEKLSETPQAVANVTGMDFKRFTQAVMLEQGRFDAFLKANAAERSQILELLTGTEIYGQISTAVYERADIERRKLDDIRIEIANMKPRDSYGTDDEILQELSRVSGELAGLEAQHKDMKAAMDWLKNIAVIQKELYGHNARLAALTREINIFARDGQRLDAALRAREIAALYEALTAKRRNAAMTRERAERYSRDIARDERTLADITATRLPELEFEYKRMVQNIPEGDTPEAVCARAKALVTVFADLAKKRGALEAARHNAEENLRQAQEILEAADGEYREILKRHDEVFTARMRNDLKPGIPCPVCGSLEHPAITHTERAGEAAMILPDFEAVSKKLREAQTREGVARTTLNERTNELDDNINATSDARANVVEAISPLGIIDVKNVWEIKCKLDQWLHDVNERDAYIKFLMDEAAKLSAGIETKKKTLQEDNNSIETITGELEIAESEFALKLREKNFAAEEEFIASRMRDSDIALLQEKKTRLDDNMKQLQALILNCNEKLKTEREKNITTQTLEELSPVFQEHETQIASLQKSRYSLEAALQARKKLQAELEELEVKQAHQEKIYRDWSDLNALIGQRDGGKFRKFAQAITLNMMVRLANAQLKNLSGRYTLTTSHGDDGMKLCVIDHEQAGEIRPTENLSGGERFIVSLALALGLSQLSGSKVRVDSLFLDEGFGSLDDDSLSTALEALGEVRQDGRMIGIISHVQALKDRIAAQINVIPKRDGVSILEGAGCSRS